MDEVVVNLLNRRFVPCFYDMAPAGQNAGDAWAYDEDAVKAAGDVQTGVRSSSQTPDGKIRCNYYAAVFITPEGKRVHAFRGLPAPKEMVRQLLKALKENPDFAKPADEEQAIAKKADDDPKNAKAQLDAARQALLVADWDACVAYAKRAREAGSKDAEVPYLEGSVALWKGELEAARKLLDEGAALRPGAELADDIAAARGRVELDAKEYEAAAKLYASITAGRRAGEALYYRGVALWYDGDKKGARELWRRHVKGYPEDRLARRSAISLPGAVSFQNPELVDREGW